MEPELSVEPVVTPPGHDDRPVVTPLGPGRAAEGPGRATMRDVAALAGVSLKTVSRVVNGSPTVDAGLAARVRRAAAQLNYRHNMTASNLRRGDRRSFMIGLMLEDMANPYSSVIYRAVEDAARARGVGVLAGSLDEDPARERELAATLVARRVDGLIIVPAGREHSYLRGEQDMGTAVVFVDRPPVLLGADAVMADNTAGAAAATAHLVRAGHRRIAFLGDLTTIATAADRYAGYRQVLAQAGLPAEAALECHDLHTAEAAQAAATALLSAPDPPTALFSAQNLITLGTVRALRAARAQHTTALVGFDDLPLADLLDPPVTIVAQDAHAIGTLAARILFTRIDGDTSPPRTHIVPTTLIPRGSGEIPPPLTASAENGLPVITTLLSSAPASSGQASGHGSPAVPPGSSTGWLIPSQAGGLEAGGVAPLTVYFQLQGCVPRSRSATSRPRWPACHRSPRGGGRQLAAAEDLRRPGPPGGVLRHLPQLRGPMVLDVAPGAGTGRVIQRVITHL